MEQKTFGAFVNKEDGTGAVFANNEDDKWGDICIAWSDLTPEQAQALCDKLNELVAPYQKR